MSSRGFEAKRPAREDARASDASLAGTTPLSGDDCLAAQQAVLSMPHRAPDGSPIRRERLVMLTRRQFAIGAAAMASAGLIGGGRIGKAGSVSFNTPLPIPHLVDAAKLGNAVRLKIASGRHEFIKGKPATAYGYSAPVLGPVVRVHNGDNVVMTIDNGLDSHTTVHWHGLSVPGNLDGGPHQIIEPGGTWRPVLKIDHCGVDQLVSPASAPRYSPTGLHGLGRNDHCGRRDRPARLAA